MDASFLIRGIIIGFSIAAPVGPIGVLCIRRTLASGRTNGLLSGLGAATADALYGSVATFGLTIISNFLLQHQMWLRLIGGVFLLFLGVKTILSRPSKIDPLAKPENLLSAYGSTFLLTLTNPLTILSFAAIFAGLGLVSAQNSYVEAGMMVLGVFLGSASWWLILSGITSLLRARLNLAILTWVNRVSGCIIFGFGIAAILGILL